MTVKNALRNRTTLKNNTKKRKTQFNKFCKKNLNNKTKPKKNILIENTQNR